MEQKPDSNKLPDNKLIRTTIFLSSEMREKIDRLCVKDNKSMVDIIRNSVNLYDRLMSNKDEQVFVKLADGSIERILIVG